MECSSSLWSSIQSFWKQEPQRTRSHKLCCQPPLTPECLDALAKSLGRIIRCIPAQNMPQSSLSPPGLGANSESGGRGAEGGPQSHQETTTKPVRPALTNQRSEVRPGNQWEAETSEGPVCQWPGVTQRLRQVPLRLRLSQLWSSDTRGHRHWELRVRAMSRVWIPEFRHSAESNQDQYKICELPAFRGDVLWPTKNWQITNNYPDYKVGRHKNSLKTLFTISLHSNPPPSTEQPVCHVIKERKETILFFLFSCRTKKLIESK